MRKRSIKTKILIAVLVVVLIFTPNVNIAFADKTTSLKSLGDPVKDGSMMQYNSRPEVLSVAWLGMIHDTLAIEFSEEMAVTGRYSVTNTANYELSNDNGKTWVPLSKLRIQKIEAIDQNSKVIIQLYEKFTENNSKGDLLRVSEVADKDDKRTLNSPNGIKLQPREVDGSRIQNITVTSRNQITFETDFRISKLATAAFTYNVGKDVPVRKVEFKNNDHGALLTIFLNQDLPAEPDGKNIDSIRIDPGALTDYFGTTNQKTILIEKNRIMDGIEPNILSAKTYDEDCDGRIDGIRIIYDELIKKSTGKETSINVDGYDVKKSYIQKNVLTVEVYEKKNFDTGSTPFIQLYGEISDLAGNIPVEDTDGVLIEDGAAPVMVSASLIVKGKRSGFGNDRGDAIVFRFSEPIYTKFEDAQYPNSLELGSLFTCVQEGEERNVFLKGKFEGKDLGTYPSNDLTIIVAGQTMLGAIQTGDLIKVNAIGLFRDEAGLDVQESQRVVKVK